MRILPQYRRILSRAARYTPPPVAGGRLLDVGLGSGQFLDFAGRIGWRVSGVDPDPAVVANARARGLEVREGGIEAFADQPESFDIITMNHVIEHVHDPGKTLRQVFRLLKPNGQFYLETPNIEARGHEAFGEYWRGLEPPRHLTVFSWGALENLLRQIGFDVSRRPCGPEVYSRMAARSLAVKHGPDLSKKKKITMLERLQGFVVKMKRNSNYRQCEFITLTARKTG